MSAMNVRALTESVHGDVVVVARDGRIEHVSIARTFLQRFIGLLGRRGIDANEGLLIVPGGSAHTWWMRFAIDLVFLSE